MLLTGCTQAEQPVIRPTPTQTSSPTPEPSPTPTDGIQVHSNPETGITFADEPDLAGDEAEVYNWVAMFQNALWDTLRTNTPSTVFMTYASAEVQASMQRIASNNTASGVQIGGTYTTTISDIAITTDDAGMTTATATVCDDFRQATYTTDAGTFTAEDVEQDVPQRNTYELLHTGEDWYFNRVIGAGTC